MNGLIGEHHWRLRVFGFVPSTPETEPLHLNPDTIAVHQGPSVHRVHIPMRESAVCTAGMGTNWFHQVFRLVVVGVSACAGRR